MIPRERGSEDQGYNGWKNYETWSVALIINNDQELQAESFGVTRDAIENGEPSEYWTEDERKRFRVADALKDWIERASEDAVTMSDREPFSYLWSQLISAALSEVDWDEIARHWIDDLAEVGA